MYSLTLNPFLNQLPNPLYSTPKSTPIYLSISITFNFYIFQFLYLFIPINSSPFLNPLLNHFKLSSLIVQENPSKIHSQIHSPSKSLNNVAWVLYSKLVIVCAELWYIWYLALANETFCSGIPCRPIMLQCRHQCSQGKLNFWGIKRCNCSKQSASILCERIILYWTKLFWLSR